jgi:hypothetical protein
MWPSGGSHFPLLLLPAFPTHQSPRLAHRRPPGAPSVSAGRCPASGTDIALEGQVTVLWLAGEWPASLYRPPPNSSGL